MKSLVQARVGRGKVDVFITVDSSQEDDVQVKLNAPLLKAYKQAVEEMGEKYLIPNDMGAAAYSRIPDIFTLEKKELDQEVFLADLSRVVTEALDTLCAMRAREGERLKTDLLGKLEELETFLGSLSLTKESGEKPRVSSVLDILKEMNRALNEGSDEFYTVPDDEYVLAQLMELSNIEMHKDFSELMDDEYRIATIDVDMEQFQSEEAVKNVSAINQKLAELFPDAQCCILGDMIEFAEMSVRMVRGEIKSFLFSFIVIAVMLILAFSSLRTGLLGMIPNVAPVILIAGFMGYLGYYLDYITMTVMPMILGIAVDDTIHLTTHLKYGLEKYGSYQVAMEASFREIGKSMFMTTAILCSVFFVYIISPLHYIFVIGILCVIGLAGALLADYTITPALLYIIKPFGKEKNKE